jgi:alkaline phosphatase
MSLGHVNDVFDRLLQAVDLQSVFLASLVEKFIPVLPSYVLFPAIGMAASDSVDLSLRCLIATIGSVGGAAGWYLVGASVGPSRVRRLVLRYGPWVFLKPQLYERMTVSYRNRPFRVTAIGQLIPTVRIFQALPAGVLRLPLLPFLAATAIGAQGWIVPLAGAGYVLRRQGWSAPEVGLGLFGALLMIESLLFLAMFGTARRRGRAC